jgi:hypothetical protein
VTQEFEKLGAFYLGRLFNLQQNVAEPDLLLYDSKDLTTHAVCVGMTGSGKTGLCLSLLEEAAIDGIPVIAIDPKGDLGNLLLTFPDLQPSDFRPWIEESEAARKGMTPDEYAADRSTLWRDGLAQWGQDGARIARFRDAAEVTIYTPGSSASMPLTILRSFDAPAPAVIQDADALRERVTASASGLLALLGIDADPIRSREHILLSNLFDHAWRQGQNLDLAGLIRGIQSPPFDKIGFMELDTFYPSKDRFNLSMQLNNLAASPSFSSWMEGEPLDIKRMLYTPQGRPRLSIVSIAHLSDAERMFFVTILLNEILAWVRSQPGTSSLRALLYMDEVFGYFPPTANPPSKTPMLTLLKQARAFGLGIVLATQNPVDLDYKGLSNTGTWFLGRLQTERDKMRVLEGLEGASASTGAPFDRQKMEATLAGLGNRVFLMNNVHDDGPVVFQTRWALSYLRGPLTRSQIQTLMAERKKDQAAAGPPPTAVPSSPATATRQATPASPAPAESEPAAADVGGQRPVVPPEAGESFVPARRTSAEGGTLVYRPALLGVGRLHFVRATYGSVDTWKTLTVLRHVGADEEPDEVWGGADELENDPLDMQDEPEGDIRFARLPAVMTSARKYASWKKDLKDHFYRERTLTVRYCEALKVYSQPDEAEDDFRIRLTQLAHEKRDLQVEKLRKSYATKFASLKGQIERAEERVGREETEYREKRYQSAISFGTSILGALLGRKLVSTTNVSRAGTAMRSASRAASERSDIGRAKESVESLREKLAELEQELKTEIEEAEESYDVKAFEMEELPIRPRKADLEIEKVALLWLPYRIDAGGIAEPAY